MKNLKDKEELYSMEFHEEYFVNDGTLFTTVMRVPGGWIYRMLDKSHNILSSNFVRNHRIDPDKIRPQR